MKRHEYEFQVWCQIAAARVQYPPDRKKVIAELYDHALDHYDSLLVKGKDPEEAIGLTLTALGDPKELAPLLGAIHPPFWGFFLRTCQILLIALLCLSILPIWNYCKELRLEDAPDFRNYDVYDPASYGGDTGRTLLHLSQPGVSFSSDGNTFTLTDAVLFTYGDEGKRCLEVRIRRTSAIPASEDQEFFESFRNVLPFIARDSLGNEYSYIFPSSRCAASVQSGIFERTYAYWINDFPADAQWVDICYERDGRSHALRVELNGGDAS